MENMLESKMIEIEPKGSFFQIDKYGYVVNPASAEKIQEEWQPLINDIIDLYKKSFGNSLRNVYIRGSVAKGEAIPGVSDIDTFSFVDLTEDEISESLKKDADKSLLTKYPFVTGVELGAQPFDNHKQKDDIIFLNQSLCVYGEALEVPKLKPGREMVVHALNINKNMDWLHNFLEKEQTQEEVKNSCVWIMKGLLRSGCEIVMERSQKYTRDLYPCFEIFSEYYPEKEEEMKEVLHLSLNPTSDKIKIEHVINTLGIWIYAEACKQLS